MESPRVLEQVTRITKPIARVCTTSQVTPLTLCVVNQAGKVDEIVPSRLQLTAIKRLTLTRMWRKAMVMRLTVRKSLSKPSAEHQSVLWLQYFLKT